MTRLTFGLVLLFTAVPTGASADVARDLQDTFIQVAENVSDSVVYLQVKSTYVGQMEDAERVAPFLEQYQGGFEPLVEGSGSGVVLDEEGHILTNYHVVRGAVEIIARLHDDREFEATLVGEDPDTDLAVVRIEADGLSPAAFATDEDVRIGQWAVAIGAPFGLQYSMTVGHVSALKRQGIGDLPIQDFIQTDASINPGNSGGPLVDIDGRVIGINTMIIGLGTGIGLAIPSGLATPVSRTLIEQGRVPRGYVGMRFHDADAPLLTKLRVPRDKVGVVVSEVEGGGTANEAGLTAGDVLFTFDGIAVGSSEDLQKRIFEAEPGSEVALEWFHDGSKKKGTLPIGERQARAAGSRERVEHTGDDIGIIVEAVGEELRGYLGWDAEAKGLMVTKVQAGSPAHRAGFEFGDVILEVEGKESGSSMDIARAMLKSEGDHVLMYVYRWTTQSYRYVAVEKP